jgi:hypothetical protein
LSTFNIAYQVQYLHLWIVVFKLHFNLNRERHQKGVRKERVHFSSAFCLPEKRCWKEREREKEGSSAHIHMREKFFIVRIQTRSPYGLLFTQSSPTPATPDTHATLEWSSFCQARGHVELTRRRGCVFFLEKKRNKKVSAETSGCDILRMSLDTLPSLTALRLKNCIDHR